MNINIFYSKSFLWILIFIVFFILTYYLNSLTPLYADDWVYTFVYGENSVKRVNSLLDIIESQYNHYFMWGGRLVAHTIAQLLLFIKPQYADLINTIAYMLLVYIIYSIANLSKRKVDLTLLLFINFLLFLCIRNYTATILWITGSANYLWTTLMILICILPYIRYLYNSRDRGLDKTKKRTAFFWTSIMFLVGIIAGWTNENMSIALIFVLVSLLIYMKRGIKYIPAWAISGLLASILGCILMISAPGNYIRYQVVLEELGIDSYSKYELWSENAVRVSKHYFRLIWLIGAYAVLYLIYRKNRLNKNVSKVAIYLSIVFFIATHIAIIPMIAAPSFPRRAAFGITIFIIISISILFANIPVKNNWLRLGRLLVLLVLAVCYFVKYSIFNKELFFLCKYLNERELYVVEQKNKGINDIVFTKEINLPREFDFEDLSTDSLFWMNTAYANYWEIHSVKLKQK